MLEADDDENSDHKRINNNVIQMNEIDLDLLKSSILFKNWDDVTFRGFIDDRKVCLQRFR
jgi:hypothetical protein